MARTTRNFEHASVIPVDAPKEDNTNNNLPSLKPHHWLWCCKACNYSNNNKNPTGFEDMGRSVKRALPATNDAPSKRCCNNEDLVLLGTTNYNFEPIAGPSGTLHNNNVLIEYNVEVPKEDDKMMYVPPSMMYVPPSTPHA
jgi:hypothetical protein